ncbi:uncharacterized protein VP01_7925g1 [Puccinia sorghi]|uniref:Uncharacterized protein n=1 Tax=Puccinia sorghi TaxID=27349 RepID=A0A0L6UBN6_9BASI|nr:uncharacterized protein VP01_7925g1 [Puccinia sorghi]
MDLLAFQQSPHNRLSDAEQALRVQLNLCFCCGQAQHASCGFSNGSRKLQVLALNTMKSNPDSTFMPSFLIDSGATHNVLSDSYARCLGLLSYAIPNRLAVSGFDGSTCSASFEIFVTHHNETSPNGLTLMCLVTRTLSV